MSEGLREAVHTTLSNLRDMVACFQPGSYSVNGDEGMTVRVVARRDVITADVIRLQQVAEQVSMEGEGPTLVVIPMILFAAKQRELKRMSIIFQPFFPSFLHCKKSKHHFINGRTGEIIVSQRIIGMHHATPVFCKKIIIS